MVTKCNKLLLKFILFTDSFNFFSFSLLFNINAFNWSKTFLYFSFWISLSLFNKLIVPSFSFWILFNFWIWLSYSNIWLLFFIISFFKSWFSLYKSSDLFFSVLISSYNACKIFSSLSSSSFDFNCSDKSLFCCLSMDILEILAHIKYSNFCFCS